MPDIPNHAIYFREYRKKLGFNSQNSAKEYLAAKDIIAAIDYEYIKSLTNRIENIINKINDTIHESARRNDIERFCREFILDKYAVIKNADIIPKLTNQGRRPEEVLFSWLRGYVVCEYFIPTVAKIFNIELDTIAQIGEDDLASVETFKRSPKADLSVSVGSQKIRIEVQSGFQGINDIKEHKVREARRIFADYSELTVCIHYDLFNGQVAFVRLDSIAENDVNFVTRQQMEGQSVFSIDQNYFKWRLLDKAPNFQDLELDL